MEMLRRLTRYNVRLYTWKTEQEAVRGKLDVQTYGSLDAFEEMPKAYYLSSINLNVTLPSIRSGIPLRVFEIMAAGGFVLTNYQPELEELFAVGKEIEVFRSFDEMEDKVRYYLTHEKERLMITLKGYQRVREQH